MYKQISYLVLSTMYMQKPITKKSDSRFFWVQILVPNFSHATSHRKPSRYDSKSSTKLKTLHVFDKSLGIRIRLWIATSTFNEVSPFSFLDSLMKQLTISIFKPWLVSFESYASHLNSNYTAVHLLIMISQLSDPHHQVNLSRQQVSM